MRKRSLLINHIAPVCVDRPGQACLEMDPLYQTRDLEECVQAMNLMSIWMS
jgi:hypothetical protein